MSKLESAETKLHELKSNMGKLGKEASAAMAAVEAQQQRLTLQRLIAKVRQKEDSWNSIIAGATTGGVHSLQQGLGASADLRR
nr:SH3 domain-containing protein 2-like [Ipomoea trifida]